MSWDEAPQPDMGLAAEALSRLARKHLDLEVGGAVHRFDVLERLSGPRGQAAGVYRVEWLDGRQVAVKLYDTGRGDDWPKWARREYDVLATLDGRFAPLPVALDLQPDCPYLAMEYVPGETLESLIGRVPFTEPELVALALALFGLLAVCEKEKVAHRDLSRGNVRALRVEAPRLPRQLVGVKAIDFGHGRSAEDTVSLSLPHVTPEHISPEMATLVAAKLNDQPLPEIDANAHDVFAACGLLLWAASGQPPFGYRGTDDRSLLALCVKAQEREPAGFDALPRWLRPIVQRGMVKLPQDRATAVEMLAAVNAALVEEAFRQDPTKTMVVDVMAFVAELAMTRLADEAGLDTRSRRSTRAVATAATNLIRGAVARAAEGTSVVTTPPGPSDEPAPSAAHALAAATLAAFGRRGLPHTGVAHVDEPTVDAILDELTGLRGAHAARAYVATLIALEAKSRDEQERARSAAQLARQTRRERRRLLVRKGRTAVVRTARSALKRAIAVALWLPVLAAAALFVTVAVALRGDPRTLFDGFRGVGRWEPRMLFGEHSVQDNVLWTTWVIALLVVAVVRVRRRRPLAFLAAILLLPVVIVVRTPATPPEVYATPIPESLLAPASAARAEGPLRLGISMATGKAPYRSQLSVRPGAVVKWGITATNMTAESIPDVAARLVIPPDLLVETDGVRTWGDARESRRGVTAADLTGSGLYLDNVLAASATTSLTFATRIPDTPRCSYTVVTVVGRWDEDASFMRAPLQQIAATVRVPAACAGAERNATALDVEVCRKTTCDDATAEVDLGDAVTVSAVVKGVDGLAPGVRVRSDVVRTTDGWTVAYVATTNDGIESREEVEITAEDAPALHLVERECWLLHGPPDDLVRDAALSWRAGQVVGDVTSEKRLEIRVVTEFAVVRAPDRSSCDTDA